MPSKHTEPMYEYESVYETLKHLKKWKLWKLKAKNCGMELGFFLFRSISWTKYESRGSWFTSNFLLFSGSVSPETLSMLNVFRIFRVLRCLVEFERYISMDFHGALTRYRSYGAEDIYESYMQHVLLWMWTGVMKHTCIDNEHHSFHPKIYVILPY